MDPMPVTLSLSHWVPGFSLIQAKLVRLLGYLRSASGRSFGKPAPQTAAEAKTAISSWWLDVVFPKEHVAARCSWAAPVILGPLPAAQPAQSRSRPA